jgi:hypothetical protein
MNCFYTIWVVFKAADNRSEHVASNDAIINNKVENIWKEMVVTKVKIFSWYLSGVRQTVRNLSQDRRSMGRDFNPDPLD